MFFSFFIWSILVTIKKHSLILQHVCLLILQTHGLTVSLLSMRSVCWVNFVFMCFRTSEREDVCLRVGGYSPVMCLSCVLMWFFLLLRCRTAIKKSMKTQTGKSYQCSFAMQSSLPSPFLKLNCNNCLFRNLHYYHALNMNTLTLHNLLYNNRSHLHTEIWYI